MLTQEVWGVVVTSELMQEISDRSISTLKVLLQLALVFFSGHFLPLHVSDCLTPQKKSTYKMFLYTYCVTTWNMWNDKLT